MRSLSRWLSPRPWWLATLLCLGYALAVVAYRGDALALVTLGRDYAPPELWPAAYSAEGYDGQSVYYLARYGFAAAPYLDVPAYRAQRILLPAAGALLSLGQVALLPWALLAINVLALAAGTALLEDLLRGWRVSGWYAAGYAFACGVFGAARLTTTETLAYALVLGGLWLAQHQRWGWCALLFALAALAKEMTLLFPAAYTLILLVQQRRPRLALAFGAAAALPFALWQGVLYARLGAFGVGSGGDQATAFEALPLMGFVRILTEGGSAIFAVLAPLIVVFVLLPTAWALWCCGRDWQQQRAMQRGPLPPGTYPGWTPGTTLLAANALLMLFVPFSTYRELLGIFRFIVGLQIAVILYAAERRQRRVLRYSTLWFTTSFLVIFSDFATPPG